MREEEKKSFTYRVFGYWFFVSVLCERKFVQSGSLTSPRTFSFASTITLLLRYQNSYVTFSRLRTSFWLSLIVISSFSYFCHFIFIILVLVYVCVYVYGCVNVVVGVCKLFV